MMRRLVSIGLMLFAVLAMSAQEIQMKLTVKSGVVLTNEETGETYELNGVYTTQPNAFDKIEFEYVPIDGLEHVDLGLSVEWATINYYENRAGETTVGSLFPWQPVDIVTQNWGYYGKWRMPTKDELDDLINKCRWEAVTDGEGVKGFWVYNSNDDEKKIFLPVTGYKENASAPVDDDDSMGYYWSSEAYDGNKGYYLEFDINKKDRQRLTDEDKVYYMAIRPVWGDPATTVTLISTQTARTYNSATIQIEVGGTDEDFAAIQSITVDCNGRKYEKDRARTINVTLEGLGENASYPYTVTATLTNGGSKSINSTIQTAPKAMTLSISTPIETTGTTAIIPLTFSGDPLEDVTEYGLRYAHKDAQLDGTEYSDTLVKPDNLTDKAIRFELQNLVADTTYVCQAYMKFNGVLSTSNRINFETGPAVVPNDSCPAPPRPIDLGLPSGTKWSPWNMGATSPTEYGRYCGWGDKTGWYQERGRAHYADGNDIPNIATTEYDIATYQWQDQWRMPIRADFEELYKYCPPQLVKKGNQSVLVFKNKDNPQVQDSLIIPLVGYRDINSHELADTGKITHNYYWTAEADTSNQYLPYRATLGTSLTEDVKQRWYLFAIRPVYGPIVNGGGSVTPGDDDSQPSISDWKKVVKVVEDANGYETAIPEDGVDLGLPSATKWAAWDIGAVEYGDIGKYYAWGETAARETYTTENYESDYKGQQCYALDAPHDIATVLWGEDWQLPTPEDFAELFAMSSDDYIYVTVEWLDEWLDAYVAEAEGNKPIAGYKITSKKYPNNYIFLPAGGFKSVSVTNNPPTGRYWTNAGSSLTGRITTDAEHLMFTELIKPTGTEPFTRFLGSFVRPVKHKK